ncbi:type II toxin-antitoxin system VapC family toxin [soil metagenome]
MSLGRSLLDSAVFIYAVGVDHPYRDPCRRLLDPDALHGYDGEVSVQAIQELLHQRARRTGDRADAARVAEAMARLCPVHDLTEDDLRLGLRLFRQHSKLTGRDALHAATAINRDIPTIISPDPDFDGLAQLRRIDPIDAADMLG